MLWRILRHRGVIPLLLILGALLYWKMHPRQPKVLSVGYVAEHTVTLWNTMAEVRRPIGDLHYGDRVEILRLDGASTQVRTSSGSLGWIGDARQIMDSQVWDHAAALADRARTLPVQARGITKTVSNIRLEPGRNSERIIQFPRGVPVLVLGRAVMPVASASEDGAREEKAAVQEGSKPKREDWLLVLRAPEDRTRLTAENGAAAPVANLARGTAATGSSADIKAASANPVSSGPEASLAVETSSGPGNAVAGWVLARFIEPELPQAIRDYASSADLHPIAWFELNRVPDGQGGQAPQYLLAAAQGPEGQACDFTGIRVYTWSSKRQSYETAYVESNLCGKLPIRVSASVKGPEFRFAETAPEGDASNSGAASASSNARATAGANAATTERVYVMQQTIVHRVREPGTAAANTRARR